MTTSICHIKRFSCSGIAIYNSEVPDMASRKTTTISRRTQAPVKRNAFHANAINHILKAFLLFLHIFGEDSEAFPSSTTKQRNILVLVEFYWMRTSGVSNEKWVIRATAQKNKFFIEDFLSKCVQIRRKLRIQSHLLKKSSMKNFSFCAVCIIIQVLQIYHGALI